jgi:hypothetical protein
MGHHQAYLPLLPLNQDYPVTSLSVTARCMSFHGDCFCRTFIDHHSFHERSLRGSTEGFIEDHVVLFLYFITRMGHAVD